MNQEELIHIVSDTIREEVYSDVYQDLCGVGRAAEFIVDDLYIKIRNELINTPEFEDFMSGVPLEAMHQREKWGVSHDSGKGPLDWFWLVGYLSQKIVVAQQYGDIDKALHHTITTAAALLNWHSHLSGSNTEMRPGIETPDV